MAAAPGGVHGFVPALTSFVGRADNARKLDGIPLAIELAAARLEALGLPQLLDRLHLLAGGDRRAPARQQSLAATIDWSYQLLTEDMRRAFRQLAIFPGPFSLDAAEDVIGVSAGPAVLHLVDCSLLAPPRPGPDGRSRYAMLETLRAFGRERLTEAGQEQETATALTRYALEAAERAAAGLQTGTGELAAARWLDAETSTVEQALAWSLEHDQATAVRLATALGPWWILRGRAADADRNLRAATVLADPGSHIWCRLQVLLGEIVEYSSLGKRRCSLLSRLRRRRRRRPVTDPGRCPRRPGPQPGGPVPPG